MEKNNDFETNLKSLDEVVSALESGELTLTEALKTFEKGINLFNECHNTLESVEKEVKILVDNLENGEKKAIPFIQNGE